MSQPTLEELYGDGPYGYRPSLPTALVFIVIYGISTIVHAFQAFIRPRRIWMLCFVSGGLIEVLGWCGRLWSHYQLYGDGFLMQICCLVIAPTFLSAGLYILLGILIKDLAPHKSYLSAKWIKIWFLVADVFSLQNPRRRVVQAAGGGIAATADDGDREQQDLGSKIMLSGIAFQLAVMIAYVAYWLVWWRNARPELNALAGDVRRPLNLQFVGMAICSLMIIVRGSYRCVELGEGFSGALAENQPLFLLDAIPVSIAILSFNFFHPRYFLGPIQARASGDFNLNQKPQEADDQRDRQHSETSTVLDMQQTQAAPAKV